MGERQGAGRAEVGETAELLGARLSNANFNDDFMAGNS